MEATSSDYIDITQVDTLPAVLNMRMPITSISLSSFYEWHADSRHLDAVPNVLGEVIPYINGCEIIVSDRSLSSKANVKKILSSPFELVGWESLSALPANSIHLPCFKNYAKNRDSQILEIIHAAGNELNIRHFTIHPDETDYIDWRWFLNRVPDWAKISVENMDIRKKSHCRLDEFAGLLREFPRLFVTLDVCHLVEAGYSLGDFQLIQFLSEFAQRISKVHLSAPAFSAAGRKRHADLMHINCADSSFVVPAYFRDLIPSSAEWLLEGALPAGDLTALRRELEYLRNVFSDDESIRIAA